MSTLAQLRERLATEGAYDHEIFEHLPNGGYDYTTPLLAKRLRREAEHLLGEPGRPVDGQTLEGVLDNISSHVHNISITRDDDVAAQARSTAEWFFGGWEAEDMPGAYGQTLYVNKLGHVSIARPGTDIDVFRDVSLRVVLTPENLASRDALAKALQSDRYRPVAHAGGPGQDLRHIATDLRFLLADDVIASVTAHLDGMEQVERNAAYPVRPVPAAARARLAEAFLDLASRVDSIARGERETRDPDLERADIFMLEADLANEDDRTGWHRDRAAAIYWQHSPFRDLPFSRGDLALTREPERGHEERARDL